MLLFGLKTKVKINLSTTDLDLFKDIDEPLTLNPSLILGEGSIV